jgi:hypothetical protein
MRFSSLCKTDMPISVSSCLSDLLRRILTERGVRPRGAGVEGNPALAAGDTGASGKLEGLNSVVAWYHLRWRASGVLPVTPRGRCLLT